MGSKPQLVAADIEKGLKAAGFTQQAKTGTSHVQWVLRTKNNYFRVTLSAHQEPFSHDLVSAMASQAGMTTKQFYEICSKDGQKKAKKGVLSWLYEIFDKPD